MRRRSAGRAARASGSRCSPYSPPPLPPDRRCPCAAVAAAAEAEAPEGRHGPHVGPGTAVWAVVPLQHPIQHVRAHPACDSVAPCRRPACAAPPLNAWAHLPAPPAPLPRSLNKQVLKAFPHPLTITALQFLIGSCLAGTMWLLGLHKRPEGSFVDNVSGSSGGGALGAARGAACSVQGGTFSGVPAAVAPCAARRASRPSHHHPALPCPPSPPPRRPRPSRRWRWCTRWATL